MKQSNSDRGAVAKRCCIALTAAATALLLSSSHAHAEVKYLSSFGSPGAGAGQFNEPASVAINNATGDVYVADRQNRRIQEFTAGGAFIRAWGFDVVASGEDNKAPANEVQAVSVKATSGMYRLNYLGQSTGGFGSGNTTAGSPTISSVMTAKGTGNINNSNIGFWGLDQGQLEVGEPIEAPGVIQPGTVITSVSNFGIGLSKPALTSASGGTFTSPGPFPFAVGQTITGPGIPPDTTILAASAGELTLSNNATATATGVSLNAGIPFDASPGEVEGALNALPKISAGGGAVSVTGGPGDATGSNPYLVEFGTGPLAEHNVERLTMEGAGLGRPTGTELRCVGQAPNAEPEGSFAYQWLADGQEIPGATAATYTTVAGDAGKAIQCRVSATVFNGEPQFEGTALTVSSNTSITAAPASSPAAPEGPLFTTGLFGEIGNARFFRFDPNVTGPTLSVGGSGGTLTCTAGAWSGGPTSYTYQWFRNGVAFGSPTTTAATSSELVLTTPDVATPGTFQCQVTATNSGGSSSRMSLFFGTSPSPFAQNPNVSIEEASEVEPVVTTTNGGAVFEICKAPPSTDVCKAGVSGPSLGQLDLPRGVAVDNSPGGEGDVYVEDDLNFRVQKFTASGEPIMTFGKNVDKTTGGKVCTAASGDTCGSAKRNLDNTPGGFGGWREAFGSNKEFEEFGDTVSVDGSGDVYVTDPTYNTIGSNRAPHTADQHPRIQKFDSAGSFIGQVFQKTGNGDNDFEPPLAVASDSQGKAYASIIGEQGAVYAFGSPLFTPEGTVLSFVERSVFHIDQRPQQVAVDPASDGKIWITDFDQGDVCNLGAAGRRALVAYDPKGRILECAAPNEAGALPSASGLAISPSGTAYVSVRTQGAVKVFELPQDSEPTVGGETVSNITTETARIHANVNPGFEPTTYTLEYGTEPCGTNSCTKLAGSEDINGARNVPLTIPVGGLTPGTQYHYRIVAKNSIGETVGTERTFTSFPFVDLEHDKCPNALARKQTGTAGMLDCRAYELASADFTGGADVVSDLAPGQTPFSGYPDAQGKVLYSVHDGGIPGTGSPTNRGPDPYVAARGADGWTTKYVGIPADAGFSAKPFSSTLAGADSGLNTFAFSGPDLCSPCFADGSSGEPLRLPDGSLVQGMSGSIEQLGATPSGYVAQPLSPDGSHFIFGSEFEFEPEGSPEGSIYDRNLTTEETQIASRLPDGSVIGGGGLGELGVSEDGSRIVIGQKVSTDAKGNSYWHLYMHVGNSTHSIDLTPGTTNGVLYGGMSADGSKVFFSTDDSLLPGDTDSSADVYEASVGGSGPATLSLVSREGPVPSNNDGCTPPGETPWNKATGTVQDCSALVLGGGAGVAGDGTIYFLSPELLDGPSNGKENQPNLYVLRPGQDPRFVATLDDSTNEVLHPPPGPTSHPEKTLISGLTRPEGLAVDQSNGDIYVGERQAGRVARFTSAGEPKAFSSAEPYIEGNHITGQELGGDDESGIAIDNAASSPMNGALYVTDNGFAVNVFSTTTGEQIGEITGFGEACGVAVDQSNGAVYVGDWPSHIYRFMPTSGTTPVSNANYVKTGISPVSLEACEVGADNAGHAYGQGYPTGPLKQFEASEFTALNPSAEGQTITGITGNPPAVTVPPSWAVSTDPVNGDLYVSNGSKIVQLDSSHNSITDFGTLSSSRGVAINGATKHVYATSGTSVVEFGYEPGKYVAIDNPTVIDAADDNTNHHWGDFQTNPAGSAIFSTKVKQLSSYENDNFNMVYRYDPAAEELACVSCLPTEGPPTGNASLPANGLGITDDNRVFFNSPDQLVLRDTNGKLDAYEWKEGQFSLISTGFSAFPSSLFSVTSDGTDAFFFTRETLVPDDANGNAMKLYDARKEGGTFVVPKAPPCAASDECHGPGTETPPPPPIGSFRGTGGQAPRVKCKKGYVKKNGKCVKKKKKSNKKKGNKKKGKEGKKGSRHRRAAAGNGGSR